MSTPGSGVEIHERPLLLKDHNQRVPELYWIHLTLSFFPFIEKIGYNFEVGFTINIQRSIWRHFVQHRIRIEQSGVLAK